MKQKIFFLFLVISQVTFGQSLPVVKANSKIVDVIEDGILNKGIWNVTPQVKPDIYYIMKSKKVKRVTFITDLDSISFDVKPELAYDFIILLNNKDSCYTQIATQNPLKINRKVQNSNITSDTIPFILGKDNFIHIKGKINGSEDLDFIFDTGAGSLVLTEKGKRKNVNLKLDGTTQNIGSGGSKTQQTSSLNNLEIGGLSWIDLPIIFINYNGSLQTDGVIGDNVFEDKIVEIDYDQKIIVVHSSLPLITSDYSENEMRYRTGQPFIELTLSNGDKKYSSWFLFDTGSKYGLSVNSSFAVENNLYGTMESIGTRRGKGTDGVIIKSETVLLQSLLIGDFELSKIPIDIEIVSSAGGLKYGILGNDILKRFNTIIDYQNGKVYLKTNKLINESYDKPFNLKKIIIFSILFLLIVILTITALFRKRKKETV